MGFLLHWDISLKGSSWDWLGIRDLARDLDKSHGQHTLARLSRGPGPSLPASGF